MSDDIDELLTMTCSIVQASSSTGDYGHAVLSWTTGTTTTASVPCLLQASTERETATGAVISDHILFARYSAVPSSLLAHGAEKTHRITTIAKSGATVDSGPFDITQVQDAAGQAHHVELRLLRVG